MLLRSSNSFCSSSKNYLFELKKRYISYLDAFSIVLKEENKELFNPLGMNVFPNEGTICKYSPSNKVSSSPFSTIPLKILIEFL